ncbi:cytochrome b/b6 domain-containing protein [Cysteiniphilum halobium]|uniref:cytochrome b/b6 domain-containing protein n=1 Tax=Cysteiniphilum halobium TaxID=2219059 RepID=UPI003F854EE9
MKHANKSVDIIKGFWEYLGESQNNFFRFVHLSIAFLIIMQIIDSNFMRVRYSSWILNVGFYIHIAIGCTIATLSLFLFFFAFKKRGIKYFYPYLFNNFNPLKEDLKDLMKLKLPNARSGSLAAIVQGLGLGALLLVLLSGMMWLISWYIRLSISHDLQELHKTLTGLIELYIYAHGALGIIHYLIKKYFPAYISN